MITAVIHLRPLIIPPEQFAAKFADAGWTGEARDIGTAPVDEHVGWNVLRSFNGLHVHPDSSDGIECATNDIHFQHVTPLCDRAEKWQSLLETQFIGIALTHKKYCVLWIANDGSVFTSDDITDIFGFVGHDIHVAIRNELMGIRSRPLMENNETVLNYYGEDYNRGDPRLFDWQNYAAISGG